MEDDMNTTTTTAVYTVHGAMEATAIAQVMTLRDTLGRKFLPTDVTPDLYRIGRAYIAGYRGTSDYVRDVRAKFEQYGRLFDAQVSGCLNWMVGEVRGELSRVVRDAPLPVSAHLPTGQPSTVAQAPAPVQAQAHDTSYKVPNGTYTIIDPVDGSYRTLRLEDRTFGTYKEGEQVLSYLSGSDNTTNYTGFAFVWGDNMRMWRRFDGNLSLAQAATVLLQYGKQEYIDAGLRYAVASGNCWRCGRTLTVPTSLAHGVGPECAKILGIDTSARATRRVRVDFAEREEREGTLPPVDEAPAKWGNGDGGARVAERVSDPRKNDTQRATRHAPTPKTRAPRKPRAKVDGVLGPRPVDDGPLFPALTAAEVF
jgi:hypothetical protein